MVRNKVLGCVVSVVMAGLVWVPGTARAQAELEAARVKCERGPRGFPKEFPEGIRLALPLAEGGSAAAQQLLARCLEGASRYEADNAARDATWAQARQWWERAVAQGQATAMVGLAQHHLASLGQQSVVTGKSDTHTVAQTTDAYRRAADLYERAAQAGDAQALHVLCTWRLGGAPALGWRPDVAQAVPLCQKAAAAGSGAAMVVLAHMHYGGVLPKDPAKWLQLMLAAVQAGDYGAMVEMAERYEQGKDVPVDLSQAAAMYKRAGMIQGPGGRMARRAELLAAEAAAPPLKDSDTVFGIALGRRLPAAMPQCAEDQGPVGTAPHCHFARSRDTALLEAALGRNKDVVTRMGLPKRMLQLNRRVFDFSYLMSSAVTLVLDADGVVGRVVASTDAAKWQLAFEALQQKYGKPAKLVWDEWRHPNSGVVYANTPRAQWTSGNLLVEFTAVGRGNTNGPTIDGSLVVSTSALMARIDEWQTRQPVKRAI